MNYTYYVYTGIICVIETSTNHLLPLFIFKIIQKVQSSGLARQITNLLLVVRTFRYNWTRKRERKRPT